MALNPPRPSFPSLNALRAFEAAARHESFIGAAAELGVTPAAVAQQIKRLEDWAGRPLFHRLAHGLRLTADARAVLPHFSEAFDRLGSAVHALKVAARPAEIQIAALPSIAQLWLSPRLGPLRRAFPGLEISVVAMEEPPDFARELFDFGLFFLAQAPPGCMRRVITGDRLTPVCAPELRAAATPEGMAELMLLHDASWREDWARWLAHAGQGGIDAGRGVAFSLYSMAVEAAMAGDGVLIGHLCLVDRLLADGRLVAPFPGTTIEGTPLSLVALDDAARRERIAPLADWLAASSSQRP